MRTALFDYAQFPKPQREQSGTRVNEDAISKEARRDAWSRAMEQQQMGAWLQHGLLKRDVLNASHFSSTNYSTSSHELPTHAITMTQARPVAQAVQQTLNGNVRISTMGAQQIFQAAPHEKLAWTNAHLAFSLQTPTQFVPPQLLQSQSNEGTAAPFTSAITEALNPILQAPNKQLELTDSETHLTLNHDADEKGKKNELSASDSSTQKIFFESVGVLDEAFGFHLGQALERFLNPNFNEASSVGRTVASSGGTSQWIHDRTLMAAPKAQHVAGDEILVKDSDQSSNSNPTPLQQKPLRFHAEMSEMGVRIWLGFDQSELANIPALVSHLTQWLALQNLPLAALVCNGKELHARAQAITNNSFNNEAFAEEVGAEAATMQTGTAKPSLDSSVNLIHTSFNSFVRNHYGD